MSFMYTRRGLVSFVLFCSFFWGIFMTGLYAKSEILTVTTALSVFLPWFLFGAICSGAIWFCMTKTTTDIWAEDIPKPPKKLELNPN